MQGIKFKFIFFLVIFFFSIKTTNTQATSTALLIYSDSYEAALDVQSKIVSTRAFYSVNLFDAGVSTPTIGQLQGIQAIMVWSKTAFANSDALGDVIAQYLELGGGIVECLFTQTSNPNLSIGGAYKTNKPYSSQGILPASNLTLQQIDSKDYLFTGVNNFDGAIRTYTAGYILGNVAIPGVWSNGYPFVFYELFPAFRNPIVVLNVYPASSDYDPLNGWNAETSNGKELFRNALLFASGCIGSADCEGSGGGCNTPLNTLENCGGCGVTCNLPNAIESCDNGYCEIITCLPQNTCEQITSLLIFSSRLNYALDVKTKLMDTGNFQAIHLFDASQNTPTLELLHEYSSVMVFSDQEFSNAVLLGNNLADYIDAGGGVVDCTFSNDSPTSSRSIKGRYLKESYAPYYSYGSKEYPNSFFSLYSLDDEHPLLKDVNNFNGGYFSYQSDIVLIEGGSRVATWSNEKDLITYRTPSAAGTVVNLNFFPVSSDISLDFWDSSTDGALIMRNALTYVTLCNFFDCDGDPSNGCETSANTINHCGNCTTKCQLANAIPACFADNCIISSCNDGYGDCDNDPENGCETSLNSINNCGSCTSVCVLPNATSMCNNGECTLIDCHPDYGDCDEDPSNGCEVYLNESLTNCGSCGNICYLPYAISSCSSGICTTSGCKPSKSACQLTILILHTVDWYQLYYGLVEPFSDENAFTNIEYFDLSEEIPTLDYIKGFDAVLVVTYYPVYNSSALGTLLADYADTGGGIVQSYANVYPNFLLFNSYSILGRYRKDKYAPFTATGMNSQQVYDNLKRTIPNHLLFTNFETLDVPYSNYAIIEPDQDTIVVGSWNSTDIPLILYRDNQVSRIVVLNFVPFPINYFGYYGYYGDGLMLIRNSLIFASNCIPSAECDDNPTNGCEPLYSVINCLGCGNVCSTENVNTSKCFENGCKIVSCMPGFSDCDEDPQNGCETELNTLSNCAYCNDTCNIPNANNICSNGICEMESCADGYGDCDNNTSNGCETNTNFSKNNCGGCGNNCEFSYANTTCDAGTCIYNNCIDIADGVCDSGVINVLIYATNSFAYDVEDKLETDFPGEFAVDVLTGFLPVSDYLAATYDVIFFFSQNSYADSPSTVGNILAEFIDKGGHVISATFNTIGGYYGGRLFNEGYLPVIGQQWYYYNENRYSLLDPNHYLTAQVNTHSYYDTNYPYRGNYGLRDSQCYNVAQYDDYIPMITYSNFPSRSVVLNFYPPSSDAHPQFWNAKDSNPVYMMRNAIRYVSSACNIKSIECTIGVCTLLNTTDNCGDCNRKCTFTNAEASCSAGECVLQRCDAGYFNADRDDINGCELQANTLTNCGAVGVTCISPHAETNCSTGVCTIVNCDVDYFDCDGNVANGCEMQSSQLACGSCDKQCNSQLLHTNECDTDTGDCNSKCTVMCGLKRILIIANEDADIEAVMTALSDTNSFVEISSFYLDVTFPTLETLQEYHSVLIFTEYSFYPAGDVNKFVDDLVDYIDAGGGVVYAGYAAFWLSSPKFDQYYAPIKPNYLTYNQIAYAVPSYPNHPLLQDVESFNYLNYYYSVILNTQPSTTVVAKLNISKNQSVPLIAYKYLLSTPVVYLNFYPPTSPQDAYGWNPKTDGYIILRNAMVFAANCYPSTDCDPDPTTCESINTLTNCGGCGTLPESFPNATTTCFNGFSEILKCDNNTADCNQLRIDGCEILLLDDSKNCGACKNACSLPNAISVCFQGECVVENCNNGFKNCDNLHSNGCEVTLGSNDNCAGCGDVCGDLYTLAECVGNTCQTTGCKQDCTSMMVLVIASYSVDHQYDPLDVQSTIASNPFFQTFIYVTENSIPSLDFIKQFDAVLVYSVSPFKYPDGSSSADDLGNLLADYVDYGGGVVVCTYATVPDYSIRGRLLNEGYLPFIITGGGNILITPESISPVIFDHPLLKSVNTFSSPQASRGPITVKSNSVLVANWTDGTPLIMYQSRDNHAAVVGLNFYPPSSNVPTQNSNWDSSTDGAEIMQNALYFSSLCSSKAAVCNSVCASLSTLENCIVCGGQCVLDNAISYCDDHACLIKSCIFPFVDGDGYAGNGCEYSANEPQNCGAIGNVCNTPNAVPKCVIGTCEISTCDSEYADCDGLPGNGCEVLLGTADHCANCRDVCGNEYSNNNCIDIFSAKVCSVDSCKICTENITIINLLILYEDSSSVADDVANQLSFNLNIHIDLWSLSSNGMPILADITNYHVIFTWDIIGVVTRDPNFGDLLADYVDQGGGLVIGMYNLIYGYEIAGRLSADGYLPYTPSSIIYFSNNNNNEMNPVIYNHPILNGITNFTTRVNSPLAIFNIANGGNLIANWDFGYPFIITKSLPLSKIVVLNVYPNSNYWSGDGALLMSNSIFYAYGCVTIEDCDFDLSNGCDQLNTTSNCGKCNTPCSSPHAVTSCSMGFCYIVSCDPLFYDVDKDVENGCELSLSSDNNNCGEYQRVCDFPNAYVGCELGVCNITGCIEGYDNCDEITSNGCEINLNTTENCGFCGNNCDFSPNSATCSPTGECVIDCSPSNLTVAILYGDDIGTIMPVRDNLLATGSFERIDMISISSSDLLLLSTLLQYNSVIIASRVSIYSYYYYGNLFADYVDRGGGVVLMLYQSIYDGRWYYENYTPYVVDQSYTVYDYSPYLNAVDPSHPLLYNVSTLMGAYITDMRYVIPTGSVVAYWGPSEIPLVIYSNLHARPVVFLNFYPPDNRYITNGWDYNTDGYILMRNALYYTSKSNFGDCDNDNTCETQLNTLTDCGGCGIKCDGENAVMSCVGGICFIESCSDGYSDCDGYANTGCEVNIRTLNNCGECDNLCDLSAHNATGECSTGVCKVESCDDGYGNCDSIDSNGCEINLLNTTNHCGECIINCEVNYGIGECISGNCTLIGCRNAPCTDLAVCIIHTLPGEFVSDVTSRLAALGVFTDIDTFDAHVDTPSLEYLLQYDSVFIFNTEVFADSIAFGNNLADYIDRGGGVVEAMLSDIFSPPGLYYYYYDYILAGEISVSGNSIAGRYKHDNYPPYTANGTYHDAFSNSGEEARKKREQPEDCSYNYLVPNLPEHPLLADVYYFNGGCRSLYGYIDTELENVITVANWETGVPLVAYRNFANNPVVVLNFFPISDATIPDLYLSDSDADKLMRNALLFSASCEISTKNCDGDDTNGCELLNTLTNCGDCGSICNLPHATSTCNNGSCEIESCLTGYENCDNDDTNGCESLSSLINCRTCGNICAGPSAITTCAGGDCSIVDCLDGYNNCDGDINNGCETFGDCTPCVNSPPTCTLPNAETLCTGENCFILSCDPNYANCNAQNSDGCEISLESNNNCGGCGFTCSFSHASASCANQNCSMTTCESDYDDCNGQSSDGCETYLGSISNCGSCNNSCSYDHAIASCILLNCALSSCDAGWDNCDVDWGNGCETDITTTDDCGTCDKVCNLPHATPVCSSGNCVVESCDNGYKDCVVNDPGCETHSDIDMNNCGNCNSICTLPHATSLCTAGICSILSCDIGWDNCDQIQANGCETQVTNATDCGMCGNTCSFINTVLDCSTGICTFVKCDDGYANCDSFIGCEIDIRNDTNHCGLCNNTCDSVLNYTQSCANSVCQFSQCNAGYIDCNSNLTDGCEVQAAYCPLNCTEGFKDCDDYQGNGCETDIGTTLNCGDCRKVCIAPPGTDPICDNGTCVYTCQVNNYDCNNDLSDGCETIGPCLCAAGFGDCDNDYPKNGCESPLNTLIHCGKCSTECSVAHGTADCSTGTCKIAACDPNYFNCNQAIGDGCEYNGNYCPLNCQLGTADCDLNSVTMDCEIDTNSNLLNCGGCGRVCEYTNTLTQCVSGNCIINGCEPGYLNCDVLLPDCETDATTTSNCGACKKVCNLPQATSVCLGEKCVIDKCNNGYYNCDQTDVTGCEIQESVSNCGGCGINCSLLNSFTSCNNGQCSNDGCYDGYANCNANSPDCETPINSNNNCGGCGIQCNLNNSISVCDSITRRCKISSCNFGFENCDGIDDNGCEVDLLNDNLNCEKCYQKCNFTNGVGNCMNGVCKLTSCNQGWLNCSNPALNNTSNDCFTPISIDNCLSCGRICQLPNANSICNNQTNGCEISSCFLNYANCDGIHSNGCETLTFSTSNCLSCGNNCSASNANTICSTNGCLISNCLNGYLDCDRIYSNGCEALMNTNNHCGACNKTCQITNAISDCSTGFCNLKYCFELFGNCDGSIANGCEVDLRNDNLNCGECGIRCENECENGKCILITSTPSIGASVSASFSRTPFVECLFFFFFFICLFILFFTFIFNI